MPRLSLERILWVRAMVYHLILTYVATRSMSPALSLP